MPVKTIQFDSPLVLSDIQTLSEKTKDFLITATTAEEANLFYSIFGIHPSTVSFQTLAKSVCSQGFSHAYTTDETRKWKIKLNDKYQLAALQYLFSVRRSRLKMSLFFTSNHAGKRRRHLFESFGILNIDDSKKPILEEQPVFTEFS